MRSSAIFPANRAKPGSLVGISTVGGLGRHFVPQVGVVMAVTPMKWPGWGRQRHALAAFGADTALNVGQPFRRGALGERSGRGSIDGSSVGFCAGPAGRMRARY